MSKENIIQFPIKDNVVSLDLYRKRKKDREFVVWMGGDLSRYNPADLGYYRARFEKEKK